jgi:hypothetical protein
VSDNNYNPDLSLLEGFDSSSFSTENYNPDFSLLEGASADNKENFSLDRETDKKNFYDSLPLVFKQAYNQSIGGMMYEMTHGKKRFNLMDAPESMVRDVAAGIFSFFASPEDILITATSAGTGSMLAKGGIKAAAGLAGREGINRTATKRAGILLARKSNLSKKVATDIVENAVQLGTPQAFMLGAYDGLYDAAKETRDELIGAGVNLKEFEGRDYGDILPSVLGNAKLSKFAKGAALGSLGASSRVLRNVPGLGRVSKSGLGFEIATFSTLSPLAYEGRAPEFTDFAMAGGIIGALKVPSVGQKFIKNVRETRLAQEIISDDDTLRSSAIKSWWKSKESRQGGAILYEQAGEVRTSSGRADSIVGQAIETISPEGGKPGKKVVSKKKTKIANHQTTASATIVDGSYVNTRAGSTMQIDLRTGPKGTEITRYQLDEVNSKKFFDFFVDSENPILASTNAVEDLGLARKALEKKNPKLVPELQEAEYRASVRAALDKSDGYLPEDIEKAFRDTSDFLNSRTAGDRVKKDLLADAVENGKVLDFDIRKLSSKERYHLTENLRAQKYIREFVENAKQYDTNLMYNSSFGGQTDAMSQVFRGFKPFYYQLTDPNARKVVRLLNNVNQGVQQKTATRLYNFMKVVNIAQKAPKPIKKAYDDYIKGSGKVTAYDDYQEIRKLHQNQVNSGKKIVFGKNDGFTLFINNLERSKAGRRQNSAASQLTDNRITFLTQMKKLTDEVYADAQTTLPNLEVFEVGYAPTIIKREFLDIMYDGNRELTERTQEVLNRLKIMRNDVGDYAPEVEKELNDIIESTLNKFSTSKSKRKREFYKIFTQYKNNVSSNGRKTFQDNHSLYNLLNNQIEDKRLKPYSLLERPKAKFGKYDRGADVDLVRMGLRNAMDGLFEKDMKAVFSHYFTGASKRIELSKAFTSTGTLYDDMLKKINPESKMPLSKLPDFLGGAKMPFMKQTEREAVDILKQSFTGELNFARGDMAGSLTEAFQTIGNLQMMGKISFGFAVIPNLTQTLISTAVEAGPITSLKSMVKLFGPFADRELRERVGQSGATLLSTIEEMLTVNPALRTSVERVTQTQAPWKDFIHGEMGLKGGIEYATQKSAYLFSWINQKNQMIAAASAEETVKKLTRIVKGKTSGIGLLDSLAPAQRKKWAINKLNRMGLEEKDILKHGDMILSGRYEPIKKTLFTGQEVSVMHPMKEKMLRSMQKFSMNTQLQRDFVLDPYLFNDPDLKPLFLFKRFGYRQATYIGKTITREVADGNIMPLLQLGMGGLAGGQFVMWSKEKAQDLISGDPQYYAREERLNMLKEPEWKDFTNRLQAVGSLGVLTDIMTDENPLGAINFFLKPVVIDDIQRIGRAANAFIGSMETNYPENWDVPFRKGAIIAAPVAGGVVGRLTRRALQTEKQEKDQVRARKRDAVRAIKDAVIADDPKAAVRIMVEYNKTYQDRFPSLRIKPSDVSYSQILKDKVERLKKQREEVEYRP